MDALIDRTKRNKMKNSILTNGKNIYFLVLDVNVLDLKLPSKY